MARHPVERTIVKSSRDVWPSDPRNRPAARQERNVSVSGALGEFRRRPRYDKVMAVRVFGNNLPNPTVRAAVEDAVLAAVGAPSGDWLVQIHEKQESPSWHI